MASTFPAKSASSELLACILQGCGWSNSLLRRAMDEDDGRLLFSVVVERLCDLFEPELCSAYASLMSRMIEETEPDRRAEDLLARYQRVRQARPHLARTISTIYVLSRVTLGADVAVTSVMLDGLARRFPGAELYLVGSRRNWELFSANPRIKLLEYSYPRSGSLAERLRTPSLPLAADSIVVDPDSRITQLGLLPVCAEEDYFFFESRSTGSDGTDALPVLASRWLEDAFGCAGRPFIAPQRVPMPYDVAISFGTGGNDTKRIPDPFEELLLGYLTGRGLSVVVDKGAGGEESERIDKLQARVPGIQTFSGSWAAFASMISQAKLYIGYDSAGQHVAAAAGIPLVSIFAGHVSERMFQRWQPWGVGRREVVKVTDRQPAEILKRTIGAVSRVLQ